MSTIKDVAKLAGVSLSTASCALNGDVKVRTATRLKVIEAAKQLNYQKNGFAADLKRNSTKTIALIMKDLSGPYFSEVVKGVQNISIANGYDLIACSTVGPNSTGERFLKEKRLDGAILLSRDISDEVVLDAAREGFPIVLLERVLDGDYISNILVDNLKGGRAATEYLIDLGHRDIALVCGAANSYASQIRQAGFEESLKAHGIPLSPKRVFHSRMNKEGGYQTTKMMILQGDLPTAVFYASDELAVGGIQAFNESGIKVPDDISVIGFDDIEIAQYLTPPLTTIRQPKYEMGTLAAHVLFQALRGEVVNKTYHLAVELMKRQSCAPRSS